MLIQNEQLYVLEVDDVRKRWVAEQTLARMDEARAWHLLRTDAMNVACPRKHPEARPLNSPVGTRKASTLLDDTLRRRGRVVERWMF